MITELCRLTTVIGSPFDPNGQVYASKPGNRRPTSEWAYGQRLTGGDLHSFSSFVIHSTVGRSTAVGYISSTAEHCSHSIRANFDPSRTSQQSSKFDHEEEKCRTLPL